MRYLIFFCITIILFSCNPDNAAFKEKKTIPEPGWTYADSLDFKFEITDTQSIYSLVLDVEHSVEYPYQNIYFNISTSFPSGKVLSQVLSTDLANKAGVWYGECTGTSCKARIDLQPNAKFNETGMHKINIAQHSRDTTLQGVNELSFLLIKNEPNQK